MNRLADWRRVTLPGQARPDQALVIPGHQLGGFGHTPRHATATLSDMRGEKNPSRWWALAGALLIIAAVVSLVAQLAVLPPLDRGIAVPYRSFLLAALGLAITVVSFVVKAFSSTSAPPIDEQLQQLAADLNEQWTKAADERRLRIPLPLPIRWRRCDLPVAGPISAATDSPDSRARFDPLPGLRPITADTVRLGGRRDLHAVYGALLSGRLVLLGPPGVGKSSAALLLLLDALHFRQQAAAEHQAGIPVPVMFTLHGWDPAQESVTDWAAGRLARTYPVFAGRVGRNRATTLLITGRLSLFLDGLDEIPERMRPAVLEALAVAPFRLVLVTRTQEAVTAGGGRPLAGAVAVELESVRPSDAARYLSHSLVDPAPAAWQPLITQLKAPVVERSALVQALESPLTLSLLRDVYGPTDPVDGLLDSAHFATTDDVNDHLLDRLITVAYAVRPGQPRPRYRVDIAHRTLRYLALRMTESGTRDLAWWRIPGWVPSLPRTITGIITCGFLLWLYGSLTLGSVPGLVLGIIGVAFVAASRIVGNAARHPIRISPPPLRQEFSSRLLFALVTGALIGLSIANTSGFVGHPAAQLTVGLAVGFPVAVFSFLGIARPVTTEGSSHDPAQTWRYDLIAELVIMLVVTVILVMVLGLAAGAPDGPALGAAVGIEVGLPIALVALPIIAVTSISAAGTTAFAAAQLALRQGIPLRLIAFLEDARRRQILRTVGPLYQFRHAKLQDRLASVTAVSTDIGLGRSRATEPDQTD